MILAAGKGTRLKPLTYGKPKALLEVCSVPLLEYTMLFLRHYGVREVVVNVHHHADQIIDYLGKMNNFNMHVEISDERDELLDTGGGLNKAKWFFNESKPFFLMASDIITDLNLNNLYAFHQKHHPLATLAVKKRKSTRELIFDSNYRLCGWHSNTTGEQRLVRKIRDPKRLAFSAVQVIDPLIFDLITENRSFSLIDLYLRLSASHLIKGFEHNNSHWFEFGRMESLQLGSGEDVVRAIYQKHHKLDL